MSALLNQVGVGGVEQTEGRQQREHPRGTEAGGRPSSPPASLPSHHLPRTASRVRRTPQRLHLVPRFTQR